MKAYYKGSTALRFIVPYFSLYAVFFLLPVLTILPISLTKWSIVGSPEFIGLKNYLSILTDSLFWKSLKNTAYYAFVVTAALVSISLFLSTLLNKKIKGVILGRTFVILPYIISSAAAGIIWRWIYNENFGILNNYLQYIGISKIGWLTNPNIAMLSIVGMNIWWSVAFNTVILLAALQGIPQELYDAAEVDGATKTQTYWRISLPMLAPAILYVFVLCVANSFQMFDEAFMMTQGGPIGSTMTLVYQIYVNAFDRFKMGYASAMSFITLAIILIITIFQFRLFGSRE